jgi:serine protease AprX
MKFLSIIALLFIFVGSAGSGTVSAELLESYWQSPDEYKTVIIVLDDQVNIPAINRELESSKLPLAARHRSLIESLKQKAEQSQAAFQKSIGILTNAGMVRDVRSHWLANLLVCETTKSGAELIANISGVSEVGAAEEITSRKEIESEPADAKLLNVESSLKTIRASEAWSNGMYGSGRIVCWIDQAVSTDHPALKDRWLGNHASREASLFELDGNAGCMNERLNVLGAMCGADLVRGDTIGAAPAAEWIAGQLFCNDKANFDQLLTVLEWAADPDGNAASFDDVPDVICMSWGVGNACQSLLPDGVWSIFQNIEFLGPVCIFAASNDGEKGAGSIGLPEAYAKLPDGLFCVGNLDDTKAHDMSGRGPSPCDNSLIKPDLVAPGTRVRTAFGEGYGTVSGTSIAAGFVAGAVALIREANPELTAAQIKNILRDTGTDLGLAGADNTFGYGLLNIEKAVDAARGQGSAARIEGLVRYGGTPLEGAHVELVSEFDSRKTTTLLDGSFTFENLPVDREYDLRIGRFGFATYLTEQSIKLEKDQYLSVFINLKSAISDNAEFDQGWLMGVEGDDATGGVWERAIPVASMEQGQTVQVGSDVSEPGEYCFVTGNAATADEPAGMADVDGGQTTLRSPVFSVRELDDPVLTFSYAYSNDLGGQKGGDFFRAQISNDGGVTWVDLIRSSVSTNGWKEISLRLADFITVSDNMVLQFIAEDKPPATLVEAAIDDIAITGKPGAPEPPRDLHIEVVSDQVNLTWRPSEGARVYTVYLSEDATQIVLPKNYFTETPDTMLVVPMNDIPFNQFYFQVTASR